MSGPHAAYIVTFERDVHDEGTGDVLTALRMIRGVLSVEPVPASYDQHIATERARAELIAKVGEVLRSP